jgi:hypothetical protein
MLIIIHLILVSHVILLARYFPTNASTRSLIMVSEFCIANCIPLTHMGGDEISVMVSQRQNYH